MGKDGIDPLEIEQALVLKAERYTKAKFISCPGYWAPDYLVVRNNQVTAVCKVMIGDDYMEPDIQLRLEQLQVWDDYFLNAANNGPLALVILAHSKRGDFLGFKDGEKIQWKTI